MVNTFVTTVDLAENAKNLDWRRLGKQRSEVTEIIGHLEIRDYNLYMVSQGKQDEQIVPNDTRHINHPATKMWYGYKNALKVYYNYIAREWVNRGYEHNMGYYQIDESKYFVNPYIGNGLFQYEFTEYSFPPWFGFPPLILSHRASLLRKDPSFYAKFNDAMLQPYIMHGYLWPCNHGNEIYLHWDMKYLAPYGAGVPAQYRIPRDECVKWLQNHHVNPKTGRSITESGTIYKDYVIASKFYGLI